MGHRQVKHLDQETLDPASSPAKNDRCYPWGICSVGTWNITPSMAGKAWEYDSEGWSFSSYSIGSELCDFNLASSST